MPNGNATAPMAFAIGAVLHGGHLRAYGQVCLRHRPGLA